MVQRGLWDGADLTLPNRAALFFDAGLLRSCGVLSSFSETFQR